MKYPKVLIINEQSINKNNATGITLRSLWQSWPKNNLIEICIDPITRENIFNIYSFIPKFNFLRKVALLKLFSKTNQQLKKQDTKSKLDNSNISLKILVRQLLVTIVDSVSVYLSKEQKKKLDKFSPQVIYTLGASVSTLKLAYKISNYYNIPIIFHYMDNWVEHIQWEKNKFLFWYQYLLQKWHKKCLKKSINSIVISPSMKYAYEKKFKKDCFVLMNAVDLKYLKCNNFKPNKNNRHFVYAGGLHLQRWLALRDVAEVLKEIKMNDVLDIYTKNKGEEYKEHFKGLPVVFHEAISHEKIKEIYESADVLVHAEIKNDILLGYFLYSISTKIPEYLATGKPVLFYGPKNMGLYSYLQDNKVAFLAEQKNELYEVIAMLSNEVIIMNKNLNSEKLIKKNHLINESEKLLKEILLLNIENSCELLK